MAKQLHLEDYQDTPLPLYVEEIDEMCPALVHEIFEKEIKANYSDDFNFKKLRTMIADTCRSFLSIESDKTERNIFEIIDQTLKLLDNERVQNQRNPQQI